jgi:hypothetical protein
MTADNRFVPFHPAGASFSMTTVLLALVPLLFATGFLTWTMIMGLREQERADQWAADWVKANGHGTNKH